MSSLSSELQQRVRYHLGYMGTEPAASLDLGGPRSIPTVYYIDLAMENIRKEAIPQLERLVERLDATEKRMEEAEDRLAVSDVEEVSMNQSELRQLASSYMRWAKRLADLLGAKLYFRSYLKDLTGSRRVTSVPRSV